MKKGWFLQVENLRFSYGNHLGYLDKRLYGVERTLIILVQFWTPSPVTQCRGERVQDHLSAHARAKPIVAPITSTCLFRREIQKLARKLFQHAAGKNVGERSYDAEKTCQTELREL